MEVGLAYETRCEDVLYSPDPPFLFGGGSGYETNGGPTTGTINILFTIKPGKVVLDGKTSELVSRARLSCESLACETTSEQTPLFFVFLEGSGKKYGPFWR